MEIRTLDEILIEQRQKGCELLPLLLPYCDPLTRRMFHTCVHANRIRQDRLLYAQYQDALQYGFEGKGRPFHEYYVAKQDEYKLELLRSVLQQLSARTGAAYRIWLTGILDTVMRASEF